MSMSASGLPLTDRPQPSNSGDCQTFGFFAKKSFDPAHPSFPPVTHSDPIDCVLVGGCLSTEWLVAAYERGIFPWPIADYRGKHLLAWFCPDVRTIIDLHSFHTPRRLLRRIRTGEFTTSIDHDFATVIHHCANRANGEPTWITSELANAYQQLHERGIAHSVEVWHEKELVGGVYGVAFGGYFSAESMFHRRTDASKVALYFLVEHLRRQGFTLLDVQVWSDHLRQFGATHLKRGEFLERLQTALRQPVQFSPL